MIVSRVQSRIQAAAKWSTRVTCRCAMPAQKRTTLEWERGFKMGFKMRPDLFIVCCFQNCAQALQSASMSHGLIRMRKMRTPTHERASPATCLPLTSRPAMHPAINKHGPQSQSPGLENATFACKTPHSPAQPAAIIAGDSELIGPPVTQTHNLPWLIHVSVADHA